MENGTIVSKSEFARLCGVTSARVSQWLSDGVVTKEALLGNGRHARVRVELAKSMLRDRLDPDRRIAHLGGFQPPGDDHPKSELTAARARTSSIQAELLSLRLAREQGDVIPRAAATAAMEALGRAVQRAHRSIVAWSEELSAVAQTGAPGAVSAFLRAKADELGNSVADLILAALEECGREG